MADDIHVKVSGSAVYTAVKNYIKDSPELKNQIAQAVKDATSNKDYQEFVRTKMSNSLGFDWRKEVRQIIREEVQAALGEVLNSEIKTAVLHAMAQHILKSADTDSGKPKEGCHKCGSNTPYKHCCSTAMGGS